MKLTWQMLSDKRNMFVFLIIFVLVVTSIFIFGDIFKPTALVYKELRPVNIVTGPPDNQFIKPIALAVGPRGQLYIVDSGNHRVIVMEEDGRFSMTFGGPGSGRAELKSPVAIDISPKGDVYIADQEKKGVLVFNGDGEYLYTIEGDKKAGFTPGGLRVDKEGKLFVFDNATQKMRIYDSAGKEKEGHSVSLPKGSEKITAMDWDPDTGKFFAIGFGASRYLLLEGQAVSVKGEDRLANPGGVVFNRSKKQTLISDSYNNKLMVFDIEGNYLGEFGTAGDGMGDFKNPAGLALDESGKLYVADKSNNRVVVYSYQ